MSNDLKDTIYLPNGELNSPFVLANANILLKEKELKLAASLFLLIAKQETYAFCGYYGLGQCFTGMQKHEAAVESFRKAFQISKRSWIATAWIDCLMRTGDFRSAEKVALECAIEFVNQPEVSEKFRLYYRDAAEAQLRSEKTLDEA